MDLEQVKADVDALAAKIGTVDHYQLLGVEREATTRQIKRAFVDYAQRLHPDRFAELNDAPFKDKLSRVFGELSTAQAILTDAQKRSDYDAKYPPGAKVGGPAADVSKMFEAEEAFRAAKRLLARDDNARARRELQRARDLNPSENEYDAYLAWCEYAEMDEAARKRNSAVEALKKRMEAVLETHPRNDDVHVYIGHIEKAQGKRRSALEHYSTALEINPHNNIAASHVRVMRMRDEKKGKQGFFARLFSKK